MQYFELRIFSFNSYFHYITRGFIASAWAFNLLTRPFNLITRAFSLPTRAFNLATRAFSVLIHGFELVTCRFELVSRGFELVTGNLCFTFQQKLMTKCVWLKAKTDSYWINDSTED